MTSPLVSVIVLSHREEFYPRAVRSAVTQKYPALEVLLKYNAAPYYVGKFSEAWQGAAGKYFVFLPDDDLLRVDFVSRLVEQAERENADMAFANYWSEKGGFRFTFPFCDFTRENLQKWCVPHMTFLVRRDTFAQLGGWDETMTYADWDFAIRFLEAGKKAVHVPEFLYHRSVHGEAGSVQMSHAVHAAALAQLKHKHAAFFAE